jgi:MFS family permease
MAERAGKADRGALLAIVAEGFFSRLSFGLVTFALPLYARERFGLSLAVVGLLAGFNMIIAILLKPVMGNLADRFGLKLSLNVSIALRSVVTLLLAVAAVPWQLFAARGVHGVSVSMRDPAVGALLAEHGGKKQIAQSFAWYQTAKTFAGNASKIASGVLLSLTANDYGFVFLVAFALSLIPLFVVVRYVREPADAPGSERVSAAQVSRPEPRPQGVKGSTIAQFTGLGFLISGSAYMMNGLFPVFAVEYAGLTPAQASLIYAVSPIAALAGPAFGWMSDNVSRKIVLSLRSTANILSSIVYLLAPSFGGVAVGRGLDDLGKAAFKPAWGALMAQLSDFDKKRRARLFGYMSSGEDAGEAAGPVIAGVIASAWGFPVLLGVRIGVAAVTEVYTVLVTHGLESHGRTITGRETYRVRVAVPLRIAIGALVGFGAGYAVEDVRKPGGLVEPAKTETVSEEAPAGAEEQKGRCSSDPTLRAIQEQTGGC